MKRVRSSMGVPVGGEEKKDVSVWGSAVRRQNEGVALWALGLSWVLELRGLCGIGVLALCDP